MIREALACDAAAIAGIQVASWRDTYRGIIDDDFLRQLSVTRATSSWLGWFFERDSLYFCRVATDDAGRVIGYAMGGPSRRESPLLAELQVLYLHPQAKRQGHGAALMRSMARGFDLRGLHALEIWSLEANPSRPFYDRLGGTVDGRRETIVGGQRLREVRYAWPRLATLIGPRIGA
ncbi:MAG: GNAT family N-acetyltransferase [Burkholderiaceae bacterium]